MVNSSNNNSTLHLLLHTPSILITLSFTHAAMHQQQKPDTLHFRHTEHGAERNSLSATVEADGLFAFVTLASGIPYEADPEHSSEQQAAAPCDARDDILPRCASTFFFLRAKLNFLTRTDSGPAAAETPIASPRMIPSSQMPSAHHIYSSAPGSAARKVRSVMHREDVLEELHVAVRLREEPRSRRQKLQSSMD